MTAWATPADVALHWADGAKLDPTALTDLLEVAEDQCRAFAPPPALDVNGAEVIRRRHTLAVVAQARENYAAAARAGGVIQTEVYAIRPRPLTDYVKSLLRPARRGVRVR